MMGVLEKLLDSAPEGPLASTHLEITGERRNVIYNVNVIYSRGYVGCMCMCFREA